MKNTIKNILVIALFGLSISSAVMAETENPPSNGIIAPYGNNPNIAHVFAYKAQEGIIDGAHKIGEVTSNTMAKVKPSLAQAWENTKNLSFRGAEEVKNSSEGVAANISEKIHNPKEIIHPPTTAEQPALQQQSLSQKSTQHSETSTAPVIQTPNTATSYAVTDL